MPEKKFPRPPADMVKAAQDRQKAAEIAEAEEQIKRFDVLSELEKDFVTIKDKSTGEVRCKLPYPSLGQYCLLQRLFSGFYSQADKRFLDAWTTTETESGLEIRMTTDLDWLSFIAKALYILNSEKQVVKALFAEDEPGEEAKKMKEAVFEIVEGLKDPWSYMLAIMTGIAQIRRERFGIEPKVGDAANPPLSPTP